MEVPLDGPLAMFMGDKVQRSTVAEIIVIHRWWDKLLGVSLDRKLKMIIDRMKKDIEHSISRMDKAEKLKQELL